MCSHLQQLPSFTLSPPATCAAIRDRIVEALDQLYVNGWAGNMFTANQAARNLINLASGATLGELGSLEEVGGWLGGGRPWGRWAGG